MKPYQELTYLGKLRRLRTLAQVALEAYGLGETPFRFFIDNGNIIYRGAVPSLAPVKSTNNPYFKDHCVLRMHQQGYQTADAITSELAWLAALRRDADLPVPEPVPALNGELMVKVSVPGVPEPRNCSLLRWVSGRLVSERAQPSHFRAGGRLFGRLHNHASGWEPPPGFNRRHLDWEGIFGERNESGLPPAEVRANIPPEFSEPFEIFTVKVRELMDAWGKVPERYGLIHGDLALDANLLIGGGEARAIDFDDASFGYWVYDLAIALEHVWRAPDYLRYREALLDGYAEVRILPEEQLERIEFFITIWHAYEMFWATSVWMLFPHARERLMVRVNHAGRDIVRFLEDD
jgi:Ser/Thr protein kinase RdoA (MazF antagonist)